MANVKLSASELELVSNPDFILTKNRIIASVYTLFGELSQEYRLLAADFLPAAGIWESPKISRGENYEELPWVMLDYPRHFSKENVFAIRTFFWWGNFFSMTLHLKGQFRKNMVWEMLEKPDYDPCYICLGKNEWEHHFRSDNYCNIRAIKVIPDPATLPFIKIAFKIPITQWNEADRKLQKFYQLLLQLTVIR